MYFFLIFFFTIFLGLNSSSFLSIWFAMELNLISVLPFIFGQKSTQESESSIKYFLIQSLSSMTFLTSALLGQHSFDSMALFYFKFIFLSSIILKMAAAPLHFWFPWVISNSSWFNVYLISVPQKSLPLFILLNLNISFFTTIFLSFLGLIFGSIGILNQFSLKKILSYSSVSHISWIILALKMSWTCFIFYFIFYSFILMEICFFLKFLCINTLSEMSTKKESSFISILTSSKFLSLGGLPPFLGFYPKSIIIYNLFQNNFIWMQTFILMMGILSLFIYTRTISSFFISSLNSLKSLKTTMKMKNNKSIFFFLSETLTIFSSFLFFLFWSI